MQQISPLEAQCRLEAPLQSAFRILIAGENEEALYHAEKLHEQVRAVCGEDVQITREFWSFALLRQAELRQQAAREAATADMIVISAPSGTLPTEVKSWMQSWPVRTQAGQVALVALVGLGNEPRRDMGSAIQYLKQTADFCGLEFLCKFEGWKPEVFSSGLAATHHDTGATEELFSGQISWHNGGLNE